MPWPLELLLLLGVPAGLGACLVRLLGLRWRADALGWTAWSWLLGTLAVALLLFVALLVGVPLAALRWVPLAALGVAVPLALRTRAAATPIAPSAGRWPLLIVTAGCLLLAGDRMLRADAQIVCDGDEGWMWGAKARAL